MTIPNLTDSISMSESKLDIQRIHRNFMTLFERRQPWDALWGETAQYYMPTSMHWNQNIAANVRTGTRLRGVRVYDDTPAWAANRFASAMLGMVMNPAQKWLEFEMYTNQENLSMEGKRWLSLLRDRVMFVLQCPDVGFYDSYHEHLLDYGIFGEAVLLTDRNPETGLPRFTPYPLEQCYIGMGAKRTPDTLYRKYQLPAQAFQDYFNFRDDVIPESVMGAINGQRYLEKFTLIHAVFPRSHGVAQGFATNKPWASLYYLESTKEVIRESGFDHFPFSCPRFLLFANEDHGQGPGTLSLANVRTLNTIIKTMLVADQRQALPAYLAQRKGWIKQLNFTPSHVNYYDGFDMDKALIPIGNDGKPQAGQQWVQMYQEQILKTFYLDRLITQEKKAEVKEVEMLMNDDERMRDLVPQLSRLHNESISGIILNVVNIIADTMPPPPTEISRSAIKIRYLSPLARAQRLLEVSNANRTLQQVILPMAQVEPTVTKTIDWFHFAQWSLDNSGFPAEVRVSEAEFRQQQAQQEQQQQAAAALQGAQGASEIAKNFATAGAQQQTNPLQGYM